jgi:hypothetical protein
MFIKPIEPIEMYEYRGCTFQKLPHDYIWYVLSDNSIILRGQYRNDLENQVDLLIKQSKP